jgi:hypothetical protein
VLMVCKKGPSGVLLTDGPFYLLPSSNCLLTGDGG